MIREIACLGPKHIAFKNVIWIESVENQHLSFSSVQFLEIFEL